MIPHMAQIINDYHNRSLLSPGTAAGIGTAEAISTATTQFTLNTSHHAGSSTTSSGLKVVEEIVYGLQTIKDPYCMIFLEDRFTTITDIFKYWRPAIVETTVDSFLTKKTLMNSSQYISTNDGKFPWWILFQQERYPVDLSFSNYSLRLEVNMESCYKHRVTLGEIAQCIEKNQEGVYAYASPNSRGLIDLFTTPRDIPSNQGVRGAPDFQEFYSRS